MVHFRAPREFLRKITLLGLCNVYSALYRGLPHVELSGALHSSRVAALQQNEALGKIQVGTIAIDPVPLGQRTCTGIITEVSGNIPPDWKDGGCPPQLVARKASLNEAEAEMINYARGGLAPSVVGPFCQTWL